MHVYVYICEPYTLEQALVKPGAKPKQATNTSACKAHRLLYHS